jgi:hypothetical protein
MYSWKINWSKCSSSETGEVILSVDFTNKDTYNVIHKDVLIGRDDISEKLQSIALELDYINNADIPGGRT